MSYDNYHLTLTGTVGDPDFDRKTVDGVLRAHTDEEVYVMIESLGGNLDSGLAISNAFRLHGNVSVHYVGLNASAATVASLGAKHVSIDSGAMYLVHKASYWVNAFDMMNADSIDALIAQLESMKSDLNKIDACIATMYAKRCKKKVNELLELMKEGGWLTAQEALDWGFVDEITDFPDDKAAMLTDKVAQMMASHDIPLPNLPIEITSKSSAIARFINSLYTIFKPKNMNEETKNTEEVQTVEPAIINNDAEKLAEALQKINELEAQIKDLNNKTAEATSQVMDSKGMDDKAETTNDFASVINRAKSMLNEI